MKTYEEMTCVYEAERVLEYRKWISEIPFIPFRRGWLVSPIPPFGGAVVRFQVRTPKQKNKSVSVYLDCYEQLGLYGGSPYWEVYPFEKDVGRCGISEVDELLRMISAGLREVA